MLRSCGFPRVGAHASQPWNQRSVPISSHCGNTNTVSLRPIFRKTKRTLLHNICSCRSHSNCFAQTHFHSEPSFTQHVFSSVWYVMVPHKHILIRAHWAGPRLLFPQNLSVSIRSTKTPHKDIFSRPIKRNWDLEFRHWEAWVPTFGNLQFEGTRGSKVEKHRFSTLGSPQFLEMGMLGFKVGKQAFQPLGTRSSSKWDPWFQGCRTWVTFGSPQFFETQTQLRFGPLGKKERPNVTKLSRRPSQHMWYSNTFSFRPTSKTGEPFYTTFLHVAPVST